ncbi:MAG: 50S ribosomal protein L17 [Candidatus Auribacterota bacterium]
MRHRKLRSRLSRSASHRKATIANIMRGLIEHERVVTTLKKAKVTSARADKLITLAKKNNLSAIRQVERFIQDRKLISKLFTEIGPRFTERNGGYTRVLKYNVRRGDGTLMAILELTEKSVMAAEVSAPAEKASKSVASSDLKQDAKSEVSQNEPEDAVIVDETEDSDASMEEDADDQSDSDTNTKEK